MASGKLIPATTFIAHSNKLRAKHLERIASMTLQKRPPDRLIGLRLPTSERTSKRVLYPFREERRQSSIPAKAVEPGQFFGPR